MLGAITGDIVGSIYEWHNIKTKDFPLFGEGCHFTDDTVMTCAAAEAIMNGGRTDDFISSMKKYGNMYLNAGYGSSFARWLVSESSKPYNSFGNGSAMRVSPCAWIADCKLYEKTGTVPKQAGSLAAVSASVTHNHPEGIKGAMAVADAIYLCRCCRMGYIDKAEYKGIIKVHIESRYKYDLSKALDEIRPTYSFDVTCQGSVPQAITAFLESMDYEDAIRNAISIGGDSDTIAAITGGIAEAAYGIPQDIKEKTLSYLPRPLRDVYDRWVKFLSNFNNGVAPSL